MEKAKHLPERKPESMTIEETNDLLNRVLAVLIVKLAVRLARRPCQNPGFVV